MAGYRHDGARGGGNLKYEFRLKPDASVEDVRLGYRGAEGLSVGPEGAAGADLPGVLKDAAPVSYYQRVTDGQLIESSSIKGATMPDGQTLKSDDNPDAPTFEEWLKSKGRESDGQNSGAS